MVLLNQSSDDNHLKQSISGKFIDWIYGISFQREPLLHQPSFKV